MTLNERIAALAALGQYLQKPDDQWAAAARKAEAQNGWFTPAFVQKAVHNIWSRFLQLDVLEKIANQYKLPAEQRNPAKVGLVLAGNIPLVGFHDVVCCFLCGHYAVIKLSSKDAVLLPHLFNWLIEEFPASLPYFTVAENLKSCDAYIATGSNNTARYFEYYFSKFPNIIRKNRTSVAVLTGDETDHELELLADDVHSFFGLGCRNITKIYVPQSYRFEPLIEAFKKYNYLADHNKYKNNYDYHLAVHLLNGKQYMATESLLLIEDEALFSPIAQLNYEKYRNRDAVIADLKANEAVQCIVGNGFVPFGEAQCPQFIDYADGVDTMEFLAQLCADDDLRKS